MIIMLLTVTTIYKGIEQYINKGMDYMDTSK